MALTELRLKAHGSDALGRYIGLGLLCLLNPSTFNLSANFASPRGILFPATCGHVAYRVKGRPTDPFPQATSYRLRTYRLQAYPSCDWIAFKGLLRPLRGRVWVVRLPGVALVPRATPG